MTDTSAYLVPTPSLDIEAPSIVETVARITAKAKDDVERAVLIHDFVRDEVPFGWVPGFDAETASETHSSRLGFCNTKTPLFVALLRAAKIPARIHFAGINKHILDNMLNPIDKFVDHAYAEAFLEGKWLKVDSFIVDAPLYRAAMGKLRASGKKIGFGLHINGTSTWDGRSDSLGQFLDDGTCEDFSDVDFGIHDDVPAFYASGKARTPTNFFFRNVILRTLLFFANRRVRALRDAS
jgi:transglutaminase-like putative cysteine protease